MSSLASRATAPTAHLCPHCSQPLPQTLGDALLAEAVLAAPPCEPAPLPVGEHRRATQDGWIWPVDRPFMRDIAAIRLRMSEDLAHLFRRRGEDAPIVLRDIERIGWTVAQIRDHATAAHRLLTEAPAEAA